MALHKKHNRYALALAALGVVYGDIGTSPLYTLQVCFDNIGLNPANVLGVISLIFWSIILVVSFCYLGIFLKADNDGEGGVLALLGLFSNKRKNYRWLFFLGIFGAGLLISDGMLTPAISVLSAIEGLKVVSPEFAHWILPLTVIVLLLLFWCQHYGTQTIGQLFGPILFFWFIVIGSLGLVKIIHHPQILLALNPYYAGLFFYNNGLAGFLLLSCIFLAITGAEALYADLGQFGKGPIRLSWYTVVLPGLVLNFFGQGAYLLINPTAVSNPFFHIAPSKLGYPLIILSTVATVIASQAIIAASFSLTKQGILLGVVPRFKVIQTSSKQNGQIYVPIVNVFFALGSIGLVLFFGSSYHLTSAYGIAINFEMVIMTLLVIHLARQKWKWPLRKLAAVFSVFLIIYFSFLASNLFKVISGGWIPLVFSLLCLILMLIWHKGILKLRALHITSPHHRLSDSLPFKAIGQKLTDLEAIFITQAQEEASECFFNYFSLLQIKPKQALIIKIRVKSLPYVYKKERFELNYYQGIPTLTVFCGFMESINMPKHLTQALKQNLLPLELNLNHCLYFIEKISLSLKNHKKTVLNKWFYKIFIFMFENTIGRVASTEMYKIPEKQIVIIGTYREL